MEQPTIPAYGELAFDRQLTPESLYRLSQTFAAQLPETAETLTEYASDLAEIRSLPEVKRTAEGQSRS